MNIQLNRIKAKLERMELEHLRLLAADLANRLEQAEERAENAEESADFWQQHAQDMMLAEQDNLHATHRTICITKGGELIVAALGHEEAR